MRRAVLTGLLLAACARPPPEPQPLLEAGAGRELAAGETARYRLPLAAGELLRLEVEQHGVDVFARLRDPAGRLVAEADRMINDDGPELLVVVAETAGEHLLELEAADRSGPGVGIGGRVEIPDVRRRPATAADRRLAEAYGRFLTAEAVARAGRPGDAVTGYLATIERAAELGEVELAAEATVRLGEARVALGQRREGREAFAAAVERAPPAGLWQRLALELLGVTELNLGDLEAARAHLEAALRLAEAAGHRYRRAQAELHLGKVRRQQGAVQPALELLLAARGRFRPWERGALALVQHELGVLQHWNLGRPREALEAFAEARRLYLELGDGARGRLAVTLNQTAAALETLGEARQAAAVYRQALELRQALGQRCAEANTRARLALAELPDPAAVEEARQARAIFDEEACPRDRAGGRLRLAAFEERTGRVAAARLEYERSLALYREGGDRAGEGLALLGLARACRRLEVCDTDPLRLAREALGIVEGTRGELQREDDRLAYGSHTHALFDLLIDLEWSVGKRREAFASAERARARAFLDRLRAVDADRDEPADPPIALGELRRALPADALWLEYRLGEARSFLWAVARDREASFELPPRAELERRAEAARSILRSPEPIGAGAGWEPEPFQALADLLLPPGLEPLLARRRLYVVADGALELLPFAALPDGAGRPLIDGHELVHLPSASVWSELRARPSPPAAPGLLAVVADAVYGRDDERLSGAAAVPARPLQERLRGAGGALERLPGSAREAAAIRRLAPPGAPTLSLLGFAASKAAILAGTLRGYRYLHFATHAEVHPLQPALSYLAFSRLDARGGAVDGDLFAHQLAGLDLQAELVVLAGCDTGIGPRIPGEGLVSGLARGFFDAGARRVVVSLWPISDRATPELIERFYAHLFESGDAVGALAFAQRQLYREGRHPYGWAGFVIQGD